MKLYGLVLLTLLSFKVQALAVLGKPAPDFSLLGHDGELHSLEDHRGKVVVLEWFNHGCPFVRKHYDSQNMQKIQQKFKAKGVRWFTIVSSAANKQGHLESAKKAKDQYLEEKSKADMFLLDPTGQVGKLYQAKVTPHMYIIDSKGILVYQGAIDSVASTSAGDIPEATNYVVQALDEILEGKEVSKARTKAYGCSVKY